MSSWHIHVRARVCVLQQQPAATGTISNGAASGSYRAMSCSLSRSTSEEETTTTTMMTAAAAAVDALSEQGNTASPSTVSVEYIDSVVGRSAGLA